MASSYEGQQLPWQSQERWLESMLTESIDWQGLPSQLTQYSATSFYKGHQSESSNNMNYPVSFPTGQGQDQGHGQIDNSHATTELYANHPRAIDIQSNQPAGTVDTSGWSSALHASAANYMIAHSPSWHRAPPVSEIDRSSMGGLVPTFALPQQLPTMVAHADNAVGSTLYPQPHQQQRHQAQQQQDPLLLQSLISTDSSQLLPAQLPQLNTHQVQIPSPSPNKPTFQFDMMSHCCASPAPVPRPITSPTPRPRQLSISLLDEEESNSLFPRKCVSCRNLLISIHTQGSRSLRRPRHSQQNSNSKPITQNFNDTLSAVVACKSCPFGTKCARKLERGEEPERIQRFLIRAGFGEWLARCRRERASASAEGRTRGSTIR